MHHSAYKYLRFTWKGKCYEFTSLPFGLAPTPLIFTKLMKPIASFLRSQGVRLLVYLDNILMAPSECLLKEHLNCTYDEPSGKSRFPTEFQKMHHRAIADNGIFRIYDKLDGDDVITLGSQSIQDTEGVSACSQSAFQYREKASSSDRASLRMHSCYLGGPSALQSSTAIETSGSRAKRKPLRSFYTDVSGSTTGSMVVDPQSLNQSLPSDTEAISSYHPGDGCLHSRVGGLLWGSQT